MNPSIQISTAITKKADRLVEQDRVSHVKGLVYQVVGDSGTYTVHLSYPQEVSGACDCLSALAVCSHLLAASIKYLADPPIRLVPTYDPFANLN